jgi:hypothetical protein
MGVRDWWASLTNGENVSGGASSETRERESRVEEEAQVFSGDGAPGTLPGEGERNLEANNRGPAGEEASAQPIFTRYTLDITTPPDEEAAHQRGHVDGTFDGDPESFEAFIEHRAALRTTEQQLEEVHQQREEVQQKLQQSEEAEHEHVRDQEHQSRLEHAVERAREASERAKAWLTDAEDRRRAVSGPVLFQALVYTLVGLAFFTGDLIVSYEVVSQALKLGGSSTGWVVEAERIVFAVAIASLTFLFKLAYERFAEQSFREGKPCMARWIVGVAAVLALVTLALLGGLRSEFVQQMADVQATGGTGSPFGALEETAPNAPSPTDGTETSSGTSWLQLFAFIGTALLFAVAGGVCFGAAATYWRKSPPLACTRWYLRWRFSRRKAAREQTERALAEHRARLEAQKADLEARQAPGELRRRLEELREKAAELRETYWQQRRAALTANYRSGLRLAEANAPDVERPTGMAGTNAAPAADDDGASSPNGRRSASQEETPRSSRRPFLDVRDDIMQRTSR